MHPDDDPTPAEAWQVEALLSFDEALAAGRGSALASEPGSPLDAVHECQRLLERVWPRSTPDPPGLPRRFGRFQLQSELGRGGFGIVFLATDPKLRREVALKLPRPEVVIRPEFRRRFLREGEAASRLDHPHIVPIFDSGEEGEVCYIVSAYCQGVTIAQWLRRRSTLVPPRLAADLLVKLAGAVGHAHERGILHRDLKPGNILLQGFRADVSPDEDVLEIVPRICDFGLAKILDEDANDTCSGVPLGSPAYMAPEQASGRLREIGPATDIYALGVILYELLVGRPPFQGETVLETLRHVSDSEPPSPRTLRPGLPRDLDTICMKCLEKRPDRRYASGSDLAEDLGRFLAGRPVKARPVSGWVRVEKGVRRRPAHAALAAVLALSLLASIVGLAWSGSQERRYNANLSQALDQTRRSEQRAHRLLTSGQIRLAQLYYDLGKVEMAADILHDVRAEPGRPDPRGFAWSYLDRLCRGQLPHTVKLPGGVSACALSPDGRTVALGDKEGDLRIWDMVAGTVRPLKRRRPGRILHLEFSPDGRTLASSHEDSIDLWDLVACEPWGGGPQNDGRADVLLFDQAGETLTTVRMERSPAGVAVRVWKLATRERRASLHAAPTSDQLPTALLLRDLSDESEEAPLKAGTPPELRDVAVTADGLTLAILEADDTIRLFDTRNGQAFACCRRGGDKVVFAPLTLGNIVFPPDEVDRIGGLVQRLTGCKRLRRLCEDLAVHAAVFSPDGASLAIFASKADRFFGEISVIDTTSGRPGATYTLADHTANQEFDPRFTADGRSLLITGNSPKALLWQWAARPDPPSPPGHEKEVWALAYSPDGRTLASSSDDHTIKLWDAATGNLSQTLTGHDSLVSSVVFSPNGKLIASASFDRTVGLWDVETSKRLAVLDGHTNYVRLVTFSPDGKLVASTGNDGTVRLWDVTARRSWCGPLRGHTSIVYSVAFSPDGRLLCSGGDDRKVCIWEMMTGRRLAELPSENPIQALVFSPDGSTLAMSSVAGNITLWDMASGASRPPLRGHSLEVLGLAFSPDGRTLASAGRDMTVRLWDPATGQELLTLKGHKHRVHAVTFSPDGSTLASSSFDGTIKLWRSGARPD